MELLEPRGVIVAMTRRGEYLGCAREATGRLEVDGSILSPARAPASPDKGEIPEVFGGT